MPLTLPLAEFSGHEWGATMARASMVPLITQEYEVIEENILVVDEDELSRKTRD